MEIKVISALFHAQNTEPRRRLGEKFDSRDHCRALSFCFTAGDLGANVKMYSSIRPATSRRPMHRPKCRTSR